MNIIPTRKRDLSNSIKLAWKLEPLRDDEILILNGVLELNTKNVETIMTPLKVLVVFLIYT